MQNPINLDEANTKTIETELVDLNKKVDDNKIFETTRKERFIAAIEKEKVGQNTKMLIQ